jgi:hypothetical protein
MGSFLRDSAAVCFLLVTVGCADAQEKKTILDDLVGDWINKTYVETLQKTKSPLESWQGIHRTAFNVKKTTSGYELGINFNFHEGGWDAMIDSLRSLAANTYAPVFISGQDIDHDSENNRFLYPDGSPDTLTWLFTENDKEKRISFVRAKPSKEVYANRIVLAGNYTDANGRKFGFTGDCRAEWPDTSFSYEIGLDVVQSHCDYIELIPHEGHPPYRFAFEWKNGFLTIYTTRISIDGVCIERGEKPLYILTPD